MAANQKTATIKTLRKWEKEFEITLDFNTNSQNKVYRIRCSDCKKWEPRIKEINNFSDKRIKGTENIAKDAVEKHVKGEPHLQAVKLSKRSELGPEVYRDSVIMNSPLAKSFLRLNPPDKDSFKSEIQYHVFWIKKDHLQITLTCLICKQGMELVNLVIAIRLRMQLLTLLITLGK